jgi:hypothetical protein
MDPRDTVRTLIAARALAAARQLRRPRSPAQLAKRLIKGYTVSPTIALISDALHRAITRPDQRICISTPPRTGKSQLVSQIGVLYALMNDPDTQVISASYADSLAWENSHAARVLIAENTDLLGFTLSADKQAVGRWKVGAGPDGIRRQGGLLAAGILSGILGFGANLLLIDDPIQNQLHADSASHRRRVVNEFRSTLMTRLMPNGSVVIISSRFHEMDLIGTLLAEEPDRWEFLNAPAISESGIPDVLGRPPGVAMISALGRTAEGFEDIRRGIGERAWYSMFQGTPVSPGGALLKSSWLDQWRLDVAPPRPVATVVAIDPADSGHGDAAGVIAASLTSDGVVCLIADRSRPMSAAEWGREAVALAYSVGASKVVVEGYAAATTFAAVVTEALTAYRREHPDAHPVRVQTWRGRGDAMARSAPLLAAAETGRFRLAGHHPGWEAAAVSWQAGQHQPDQLAASVIAFDVLSRSSAGQGVTFAVPSLTARLGGGGPGRTTASRLARGGVPGRTTAPTPMSTDDALAYRRRLAGGRYR